MVEILIAIILFYSQLQAQSLNVRATHPMAIQHQLPTGEAPGWNKSTWVQIDVSNGNHWAEPTKYRDRRNNNVLVWDSDFEQTTTWLEIGKSINKKFATSIEIPYVARHAGSTTDDLIDGFHDFFGFSRFGRQRHAEGRVKNETQITQGGTTTTKVAAQDGGFSNIKWKLKYWPVQWKRNTGIAVSFHTKVPIEEKEKGITSGSVDYSGLFHFALPIFEQSAVYLTAGATYVTKNWQFDEWPRNRIIWLMDMHFDLSLSEKWSFIFNHSVQGPFLKRSQLEYDSNLSTEASHPEVIDRNASNYSALVNPRGQQIFGLKRSFNEHDWMIYLQEDWNFGSKDLDGELLYSHNQPDFSFGLKFNFSI